MSQVSHKTIKASEAEVGRFYWVSGKPRLCCEVACDDYLGVFYYISEKYVLTGKDVDIIPLPDDVGYDYQLPPPEPRYRPFANAEEFEPHRDRWIDLANAQGGWKPWAYTDEGVFSCSSTPIIRWQELFDDYKWGDTKTPVGVEVTQ